MLRKVDANEVMLHTLGDSAFWKKGMNWTVR